MDNSSKGKEFIDNNIARTYKLEIVIGEGRILDAELLQKVEKIAMSSIEFSFEEKEFFLSILNNPELQNLEEWKLVKFINVAEKANVKIILLGKAGLIVKSTEESRQQFITKLKDSYLQVERTKLRHLLENDNNMQDINEAYVNLAIVKKQKSRNRVEKSKKQHKEIADESIAYRNNRMISSYEQIYGKKEDFPLAIILSPLENSEKNLRDQQPRNVLIEGWAGIGKTVLCQYLTVLWARDYQEKEKRWWLNNTQVVLWIKLRNLTRYNPDNCRLGEVVRRECFGVEDSKDLNCPSALQIEADLEAMGENVVLLLDGFDEVAEWYEEYKDGSHQILTARSELLKLILLGKRHKHHVILTSRPSRIDLIDKLFDRRLETTGFKDKDIEEYVQTFFKEDTSKSTLLLSNLRQNGNLWGIAHIPVNLTVICLVWKERERKEEIVTFPITATMTELYSEAILWLLRRDWAKHPIWNEDDQELTRRRMAELGETVQLGNRGIGSINNSARELIMEDFETKLMPYAIKIKLLEELAWKAQTSKQHTLLISGEKVIECLQKHYGVILKDSEYEEILQAIRKIGLLESQYSAKEKSVNENYYYFPHLTIQEYFSAKHWVRLFYSDAKQYKEEAKKQFNLYKYDSHFEMVWPFVAGLLKDRDSKKVSDFFQMFQDKPRDILGIRHAALSVRYLEESEYYRSEDSVVDDLIDKVIEWIEWSISIGRKTINRRIFYDALNQCSGVKSHSKITSYLLRKIMSLEVCQVLKFLWKVPPLHRDLIEAIYKQLDSSVSSIQNLSLKLLFRIRIEELEDDFYSRLFNKVLNLCEGLDKNVKQYSFDVLRLFKWDRLTTPQNENRVRAVQNLFRDIEMRTSAFDTLSPLSFTCVKNEHIELLLKVIISWCNDEDGEARALSLFYLKCLFFWDSLSKKQKQRIMKCYLKYYWDEFPAVRDKAQKGLRYLLENRMSDAEIQEIVQEIIQENNRAEIVVVVWIWSMIPTYEDYFSVLQHLSQEQNKIILERAIKLCEMGDNDLHAIAIRVLGLLFDIPSNIEERETIKKIIFSGCNHKEETIYMASMRALDHLSWDILSVYDNKIRVEIIKTLLENNSIFVRWAAVKSLYAVPLQNMTVEDTTLIVKSLIKVCEDDGGGAHEDAYDILSDIPWNNFIDVKIRATLEEGMKLYAESDLPLKSIGLKMLEWLPWNRLTVDKQELLIQFQLENQRLFLCRFPDRLMPEQYQKIIEILTIKMFDESIYVRLPTMSELREGFPWEKVPEKQRKIIVEKVLLLCIDEDYQVKSHAQEILRRVPLQCLDIDQIRKIVTLMINFIISKEEDCVETGLMILSRVNLNALSQDQYRIILNRILCLVSNANSFRLSNILNIFCEFHFNRMSQNQKQLIVNSLWNLCLDSKQYTNVVALKVLNQLPWDDVSQCINLKIPQITKCVVDLLENYSNLLNSTNVLCKSIFLLCLSNLNISDQNFVVQEKELFVIILKYAHYLNYLVILDDRELYFRSCSHQVEEVRFLSKIRCEDLFQLQTEMRAVSEIPLLNTDMSQESSNNQRLISSYNHSLFQTKPAKTYNCKLGEYSIQFHIQFLSSKKIKINFIALCNTVSEEQLRKLKYFLRIYLEGRFLVNVANFSTFGTSVDVEGDECQLNNIIVNENEWLTNDFPKRYSEPIVESYFTGCVMC